MKLTYYPGCSLESTAAEYNASACAVFRALGVELAELDDWNCCGATPAHATSHYLSLALPMRNLVRAERAGYDVVAPCAACYNVMKYADHQVRQQAADATAVNADLAEIMGAGYSGSINVRHPLEIFSGPLLTAIKARVTRPLTGLRLATYYGCLLSRPKKIVAFEDANNPVSMDKVLTALGAEVKPWSYKTDCCGGTLAMARTEAVATLVGKLITEAQRAGADAIVSACPLCLVNLDTRQTKVAKTMPIFYFTELMGISFGLDGAAWLAKHLVDPRPVLAAAAQRGGKDSD